MSSKSGLLRGIWLLGLLALVMGVVAACTSSPTPTAEKPTQAPKAEAPKEAPKAEAPAPAKKEPGKPRNIGIVANNMAVEGVRRMAQGEEEAAKVLGWNTSILDAKGDLTQPPLMIDNLVQQKVDAILLAGIQNQFIEESAKKAKAANIPLATVMGSGYSDLLMMHTGPDFPTQGSMMARVMLDTLGYKGNVVLFTLKFALPTVQREEAMKAYFKCYPDMKIVAEHELDYTNPIEDTRKSMETILLANPKGRIDAVVAVADFELIGPLSAIEAAGRNEIKAFGFDGDVFNLDNMRKGGAMYATIATPIEQGGWIAVDGLRDFFDGKQVNRLPAPLESELLTKSNLPPSGDYQGRTDWRAKFKQKWGL